MDYKRFFITKSLCIMSAVLVQLLQTRRSIYFSVLMQEWKTSCLQPHLRQKSKESRCPSTEYSQSCDLMLPFCQTEDPCHSCLAARFRCWNCLSVAVVNFYYLYFVYILIVPLAVFFLWYVSMFNALFLQFFLLLICIRYIWN